MGGRTQRYCKFRSIVFRSLLRIVSVGQPGSEQLNMSRPAMNSSRAHNRYKQARSSALASAALPLGVCPHSLL